MISSRTLPVTDRACSTTNCTNLAGTRRTVCSTCRTRAYYAKRPGYKTAEMTRRKDVAKAAFIDAYGGKCECCGETQPMLLTLDHVGNDGGGRNRPSRHYLRYREAVERQGSGEFALLCFNCNTGRHINGGTCPHQG